MKSEHASCILIILTTLSTTRFKKLTPIPSTCFEVPANKSFKNSPSEEPMNKSLEIFVATAKPLKKEERKGSVYRTHTEFNDMPSKLMMSPLNPRLMPEELEKTAMMPGESVRIIASRQTVNSSHLPKVFRRYNPVVPPKHKPLNSICHLGRDFKGKKAILASKRVRNEDGVACMSKKLKSMIMQGGISKERNQWSRTTSRQTVASSCLSDQPKSVDSEQKGVKSIALSDSKETALVSGLDCDICSPIIDDDSYEKAGRKVWVLKRFRDAILNSVTDPIQKERQREHLRSKIKGIEHMMSAYNNGKVVALPPDDTSVNYKKRIAARLALEKVVQTVEFNDPGDHYMDQLHRLCHSHLFDLNFTPSDFPNPLEWLGLSLKVDSDID